MNYDLVFKAMADPTRRRILQVLARTELAVSELVDVLRVPQSTISRHLKTLREAGLVGARHQGTAALYFPAPGQNGNADGLGAQMLGWAADQELPGPLEGRIDQIIASRRSESEAFFARTANRWDQMRIDCFGPSFHLEALTALLPHEWSVADVGTGTGYLLPILAATFARVIAIDPVEEMLTAARQRATHGRYGNVEFRAGAAHALPLADEEIDLCIASLVLHHEPKPADALAEFARVVRTDGAVLIVEQRSHQLAAFHDMMQDRLWGFEPEELAGQVRDAGFSSIRMHNLTTTEPTNASAPEAPALFALTARRNTA